MPRSQSSSRRSREAVDQLQIARERRPRRDRRPNVRCLHQRGRWRSHERICLYVPVGEAVACPLESFIRQHTRVLYRLYRLSLHLHDR